MPFWRPRWWEGVASLSTLLPRSGFAKAVGRTLPFRVHLELEGIPPHACSDESAVAILGSSCKVERLGSETASKADLGRFRVFA